MLDDVPYVPEAPKTKIADHPHRITILLGLLSPTLAVVAVILSWFSYHTSERAMKIGQRAYVVVKASTSEDTETSINNSVAVRNPGNTPGHVDMTVCLTSEDKIQSVKTARMSCSSRALDPGPKDDEEIYNSNTAIVQTRPAGIVGGQYKVTDTFGDSFDQEFCFTENAFQSNALVECGPNTRTSLMKLIAIEVK